MRLAIRRLLPAPNQNINKPGLWQDPVLGYYETHGKMEFLPGEQYNMTDEEKKAVLWRYRVKEILKKEYLRREYDPETYRYRQGAIMDPAMFRWYAADMTQSEYIQYTPRTFFLYFGLVLFVFYFITKIAVISGDKSKAKCADGTTPWWERNNHRALFVGGSAHPAPHWGWDY